MRRLLILIISALAFSCNPPRPAGSTNSASLERSRIEDSIERAIKADIEDRVNETFRNTASDTTGDGAAPVKVLSAKFTQREYSNYKDVHLRYKNVSGKKISAIRFQWYGENAFGEPAEMSGSIIDGYGGGFDDDGLSVGRTTSGTWSVMSNDGKKIIRAWVTEVAFEDGTKWDRP